MQNPKEVFWFWFGLIIVFYSGYIRELDGRMKTILEIVFSQKTKKKRKKWSSLIFISFFQLPSLKSSSYNNIITQSPLEVP